MAKVLETIIYDAVLDVAMKNYILGKLKFYLRKSLCTREKKKHNEKLCCIEKI